MARMILGCCLAIVGEDGKNRCPVAIGMVVELETRSHVAKWFSDVLSSQQPGFETSAWRT
jgi:hypothetical protein